MTMEKLTDDELVAVLATIDNRIEFNKNQLENSMVMEDTEWENQVKVRLMLLESARKKIMKANL